MEGETVASMNHQEQPDDGEGGQSRQRSTIAFPYADLGAALAVAHAIHDQAGTADCSLQQLAAWMDQSIKSSGFRLQLSTSRLFGVIENEGSDAYRLTSLGRQIVDPQVARKAKAEAFLNVPLFKVLFKNHSEGVLPPAAALEREIASLGVAEKQKDRARQVFERSADQAGFFAHGRNRLVMPAVKNGTSGLEGDEDRRGNDGGNEPRTIDPIIRGLLARLPETGAVWPETERELWLELLKGSFKLIYKEAPNGYNKTREGPENDTQWNEKAADD